MCLHIHHLPGVPPERCCRLHFRFPSFRDLPKHPWRGRSAARAVQQPNLPAELPCDSQQALQKANIPLSSSAPKGCFNYCLFLNRPEHDPPRFCYSFTRQHGDFRLLTGIIYCPCLFLALGDGSSLGMEGICLSGKVSLFHSSSRIQRQSSQRGLPMFCAPLQHQYHSDHLP